MKYNLLKKFITLSVTGLSFVLFACGDDDSSSTSPSDKSAATFDELDECNENLASQVYFVEDDSTYFFCNGKKWTEIREDDVSSSSEKKGSSSSGKATSSDSKDDSSSDTKKDSSSNSKDDSTSNSKEGSSSSSKTESSDSEVEESSSSYEKVDLSKTRPVSGVAQIGLFKIGTDVKVYEMDRDYLTQTGKVFSGKVTGDHGEFTIENIPNDVKVATVEADGFFTDEYFGTTSRATVKTLVNMDNATNLKINPISTMAYDRAVYLVVNKGLDVDQARKQAELDVLKAFAMASADTCFGQWDFTGGPSKYSRGACQDIASAILLLLEAEGGNVSTLERMARVAIDLKTDGVVSDDSLNQAQMADSYLRRAVWNDWDEYNPWPFTVNDKEDDYMATFMEKTLGFAEHCFTTKVDLLFRSNNRFSEYYREKSRASFRCWATQQRYDFADVVDRNTSSWKSPESCTELRQGEVDPDVYFYRNKYGEWLVANENKELGIGSACCSENSLTVGFNKLTSKYLVCDADQWKQPVYTYFTNNKVSCEGDLIGKTIEVKNNSYELNYTCTASGWTCSMSNGEECLSYQIPKP